MDKITNKEITIYDIAARLDVSSATVSRALKDDPVVKEKTRKKIFEMADKLGYRQNHFARNLRNQKTYVIGIIVQRINSSFIASVISGIEKVANSEGYNIVISQSEENAAKEIANVKTMFNNRVDGLLVSLAFDTENIQHFEPFFKRHIPVVFFDRVEELDRSTKVLIDNRSAAYDVTKHLINEGCRRIVHVTADSKRNVYVQRLAGYKKALADNNIKFSDECVILSKLNQEAGAEAAKKILEMNPLPDGVFVANDNCAAGCMVVLKKAGIRIPHDIAFAGFNNDPVSTIVEPNLTTVNYPAYEMGEIAARNLIQQLKNAALNGTDSIILKSELIIRESSKRSDVTGLG